MSDEEAYHLADFIKKSIGAVRNIDDGGSLTVITNCLMDTGSRMDKVMLARISQLG